MPALSGDLYAIKWCADGRSLFVRTGGIKPLRVYRLELSSGRLTLWKAFSVSDIGTGDLEVIPTPDGKSVIFNPSAVLAQYQASAASSRVSRP